jgi:hypothetical protein
LRETVKSLSDWVGIVRGKYQLRITRLERRLQRLEAGHCNCDEPFVVCEIAGEKYDREKVPPCPKHGFRNKRMVVVID